MAHHDKILIVDFGLPGHPADRKAACARRGVYSEIVPFQSATEAFRSMNPKAVILSGGPAFCDG